MYRLATKRTAKTDRTASFSTIGYHSHSWTSCSDLHYLTPDNYDRLLQLTDDYHKQPCWEKVRNKRLECVLQPQTSPEGVHHCRSVIIAVGMALSDVITVAIAPTACRIFTATNLSRSYAQWHGCRTALYRALL